MHGINKTDTVWLGLPAAALKFERELSASEKVFVVASIELARKKLSTHSKTKTATEVGWPMKTRSSHLLSPTQLNLFNAPARAA